MGMIDLVSVRLMLTVDFVYAPMLHLPQEEPLKKLALIVAVAFVPFGQTVQAQSYTVTTPGQPTTSVDRNPLTGGYTITTPGQPWTSVSPNPLTGGYTITTPGQPTTSVN